LPHGFGEQVIEGGDVGESPRALEGLEEMSRLDVGNPLVGMKLKELLSGGGTAQASV
jgi:hypothetical protein